MVKSSQRIFFAVFSLTLTLGLTLFFSVLPAVWAANIDVTANVPTTSVCGNSIVEGTEQCDGQAGISSCYNLRCNSNCTCPVCGNGAVDSGEDCESDTNCTAGFFCNTSCLCQFRGNPCVPGACSITNWSGVCIGGWETGSGTNGCGPCSASRPCGGAACGNGVLETGEECDDGNTVSGDGCSATCQVEVGCGNGVVEGTEQCDDGNLNSGDCCSAHCFIELLIKNVNTSVTQTSATISWKTPCQPTVSLLEWGKTVAVSDGSASGLSGSDYSYTITGLEKNTVYYFRVTATAGVLQAVETGSFVTAGGVEICNNGIDDDHNGRCDYPASTCTDGSVPGDTACVCTADFACTHGPCGPNQRWTMICVDQSVPKCQPDYEYEADCGCQLSCSTCQHPDAACTLCLADPVPCCGNGVCEAPTETAASCPIDCVAPCISEWECGLWQPEICPENGIQTRQCFDKKACPIPTNPPPNQQSCTPQCPGLSCGTCEQINVNQCICEKLVPCCGNGVCETGENHDLCPQDCIAPCTPNWTCTAWGPCNNGISTRQCSDLNNCNLNLDRPPEVRSCGADCEVACHSCQQINLSTCSCAESVPCCGNHICEPEETVWSCPVDCGLPPTIRIVLPECLDGLDNDRDGLVDYPADPDCKHPFDKSELGLFENINKLVNNLSNLFRKNIIENTPVQVVNKRVAAPVLVTAVAINTFATFSFFNFFSYLQYLVSQPLAALFRRRRRKWGIVYNSLTKQPIDLAIVRLYQKENGRLVQSRVTDKVGRYSFLVPAGNYYLTVTKPNYVFPTNYLRNDREDSKYLDLYHGETIAVVEKNAGIAVNIPLDPVEQAKPTTKIIIQHYLRKLQYAAAFLAVPLATISMLISPGPLTFTFFIIHCLLYILFRRLGYEKPPKNWGVVYDNTNHKPIVQAVARIYDKKYNKLLETRVTDLRGRYAFLVNDNVYYLTAEKGGYQPYKSNDIDLIKEDREKIVNLDIGLAKLKTGGLLIPPGEPSTSKPEDKPVPPSLSMSPTPPLLPAAPDNPTAELKTQEIKPATPVISQPNNFGVGRESLEELLKKKESEPGANQQPITEPNQSDNKPPADNSGTPKETSIFG